MSTSAPDDDKRGQEETPPTLEQMQRIAQDAAAAAVEAANLGRDAGRAGEDGARRSAEEMGLRLPDEVLRQISDMFTGNLIGELEKRGAFAGTGSETENEREEGEKKASSESPEPAAEQPKKTFAQRFLGM